MKNKDPQYLAIVNRAAAAAAAARRSAATDLSANASGWQIKLRTSTTGLTMAGFMPSAAERRRRRAAIREDAECLAVLAAMRDDLAAMAAMAAMAMAVRFLDTSTPLCQILPAAVAEAA